MRQTSRRQLLRWGGAALGGAALLPVGNAIAQAMPPGAPGPIRVGAVLPTRTGMTPIGDATSHEAAADAAASGVIMAGEEYAGNAALLGLDLKVLVATAPGAQAARRAAARMLANDRVFALIGGFSDADALALADLAEERQVPFFNIGATGDALRGADCRRYTFHVQASAAMYLDAMAAWYVHSGLRTYFFVVDDTPEGEARYQRMKRALDRRHFGAREVGRARVPEHSPRYVDVLRQIGAAAPDVVVLLTDAVAQLDFLGQYETARLPDSAVSGFPDATAQTRAFYAASRNASARAGSNFRATLFEATMDNYGARELNARFLERWNRPMDPSAWAGYEAVKMLYEAAAFSGTTDGPGVVSHLENPATTFDVHKGIGVSFRPWDHQLRQPLYLVKINAEATNAMDLAVLAGELPEMNKPGTTPIERLDQIGELQSDSSCHFKGTNHA